MGCSLDTVRCRALVDTGSTVSLIREGLLSGTDTKDNGMCWTTTITGKTVWMAEKKIVRVAVGNWALKHAFVMGNIQDACIIGVDLLEQWDAVVDVAARKFRTRLGTLEQDEPDWLPVLFSPLAPACTD